MDIFFAQADANITVGGMAALLAAGLAWFGKFVLVPIRDKSIESIARIDTRHEEYLKDQVARAERAAAERAHLLNALKATCDSVEEIGRKLDEIKNERK